MRTSSCLSVFVLCIVLVNGCPPVTNPPVEPTPTPPVSIAEVVDRISMADYRHYLNDMLYTHLGDSRGPRGQQHDPARTNIFNHFVSLGLATTTEPFTRQDSTTGSNVVGIKFGTVRPQEIHIVCAHYDSRDNPGADDNASGVAAVMATAGVLANYPTEATITFIAFDSEETGQEGSHAYVARHRQDLIVDVLNVDMIGYNNPADNSVYVMSTNGSSIQDDVAAVVALYGQGVEPVVTTFLELSDHLPFESFTNVCLLRRTADSPHYHKASDAVDTAANIDYAYAANITRAIVGHLATQAVVLEP